MPVSYVGRMVLVLVCIGCAAAFAQDRPRLNFADQIQLLDCQPVTPVPCFSASFNVVDSNGAPVAVNFPKADRLPSALTVTADDLPVKIFYASTSSSQKLARGRVVLVLVDISGSMARRLPSGETRFEAARSALAQFLDTFQDGVDEVAIAPFESHDVSATIHAATFAHSKEQALAQVRSIPEPGKHNNTALYSAVSYGLDVLADRVRTLQSNGSTPAPETTLVVMTDGKNEVLVGDDAGLLSGAEGLNEVAGKVSASRLQVLGIGFGERSNIDVAALQRMSTDPPLMAADADSLRKAFVIARRLILDRLQVAFLSPWPDRATLAGRSVRFKANLILPDGSSLASNEALFGTPQMGLPLFSSKAGVDELAALNRQIKSGETGWLTLLRPIFVFLGLGGILLVAWFWIPRLVWPGQYIGRIAFAKPAGRWAGPSRGVQPAPRPLPRNAPPGFEQGKSGSLARTPQDVTVVQPATEDTRIRLRRDYGS
jgi:Mg-chelatase subunit ChlD